MAAALHDYWAQVFREKPRDDAAESWWIDQVRKHGRRLPDPSWTDPASWRVTRHHVRKAIRIAGNSAPGPDGILYGAYAQIEDVATEVLWQVLDAMTTMTPADLQDWMPEFNEGLLVCLAKGDGV
jgi:hypothetical protein